MAEAPAARRPAFPVRAAQFGLRQVERPFRALGRGLRWHLLPYLRSCYLTLRYVDEWAAFPAIRLHGPHRFRVVKAHGARVVLHGRLHVRFLPGARTPSVLQLGRQATFELLGDFEVSEDVRIQVAHKARLEVGGRRDHVFSGATGQCIVYVLRQMRIGHDAVLGWRTLVMDSDWHAVDGAIAAQPTEVGDHAWLCAGAQVLKGARIGPDSIVAGGAVVLAGDHPANSLLAGVPARRVAKAPPWSYW